MKVLRVTYFNVCSYFDVVDFRYMKFLTEIDCSSVKTKICLF